MAVDQEELFLSIANSAKIGRGATQIIIAAIEIKGWVEVQRVTPIERSTAGGALGYVIGITALVIPLGNRSTIRCRAGSGIGFQPEVEIGIYAAGAGGLGKRGGRLGQ